MGESPPHSVRLPRRTLLAGALAALAARPGRAEEPPPPAGADAFARERRRIEAQAARAGLGPFRAVRLGPHLALGDASEDFLRGAARLSDTVRVAFLDHFRALEFAVRGPTSPLPLVALATHREYAKFLGTPVAANDGGTFNRQENYTIVFDGPSADPRFPRDVSETIAHETIHQLCFNCGLFERSADVPFWVQEGLAVYGEIARPDGRPAFGRMNTRLDNTWHRIRSGRGWVPLPRLFTDDRTFYHHDTDSDEQLNAYAQAGLLVQALLDQEALRPRFRRYLAAIKGRTVSAHRLGDVAAHLGEPRDLEILVRRQSARIQKALPSRFSSPRRGTGGR